MERLNFKTVKKGRPLRRRESSGSSVEDDGVDEKLQLTLELQRLRKRPKGVTAAALASGKKVNRLDEMLNDGGGIDDSVYVRSGGGLLSLEKARVAKSKADEEDGSSGVVGTQFSKETQVRDEDEEMCKFIENEMENRRRVGSTAADEAARRSGSQDKYMSPEDAALADLPVHLKASTGQKSEEMLSSQMLSGIPEVDLGIEEKIRNIEATEAAKRKAVERTKKSVPSEFVPTNLAVNFRHYHRPQPQPQPPPKQLEKQKITKRTVVVGEVPDERVVPVPGEKTENDPNRATDDLHLTKFKKHFQRK